MTDHRTVLKTCRPKPRPITRKKRRSRKKEVINQHLRYTQNVYKSRGSAGWAMGKKRARSGVRSKRCFTKLSQGRRPAENTSPLDSGRSVCAPSRDYRFYLQDEFFSGWLIFFFFFSLFYFWMDGWMDFRVLILGFLHLKMVDFF